MALQTDKKKNPNDYPMFSFRLESEQKEIINQRVQEVVDLYNEKKEEDSKVIRKNTVLVKAVLRGLESMREELNS